MDKALSGSVVSRSSITGDMEDEIFMLFRRYYRCAERAAFEHDLAQKDWVLLLRDMRGAVRGFTTMKLYEVGYRGRRVRALFNGNTIIEQDYWGDQELVRSWCDFMAALEQREPRVPLYWYLICSGFRTYLFLPLFFRSFYPRCGSENPPYEQGLIDHLGHLGFPGEYEGGVVRPPEPRECLRQELAVPTKRRLQNRHVRFFLERNPGYLRGNELVCLAEFSAGNTRRTAHDAIARFRGVA